jgi:hypothetical protein
MFKVLDSFCNGYERLYRLDVTTTLGFKDKDISFLKSNSGVVGTLIVLAVYLRNGMQNQILDSLLYILACVFYVSILIYPDAGIEVNTRFSDKIHFLIPFVNTLNIHEKRGAFTTPLPALAMRYAFLYVRLFTPFLKQ